MIKLSKVLLILLGMSIVACSGSSETENSNDSTGVDKAEFLKNIDRLDDSLNTNFPSQEILKEAVTAFQDYAVIYPEDEKAPDYLLKAADIAFTLGQHPKSVKILNQIIDKYPDYSKIESVYYNRASHTDFELRDTSQARIYYVEFMEMFPKSDFNDDAQARLDQNFMSLEELVESFTKLNNLNDSIQ